MFYFFWLVAGLLGACPLLYYANKLHPKASAKLLGRSLVIAALIYVGFAVLWGDGYWLQIESTGVALYGVFYWLGLRYHMYWIGLGWLLHPVWDIVLHLLGPGVHVVPEWYAIACVSFDFAVAAFIFIVYSSSFKQTSQRRKAN